MVCNTRQSQQKRSVAGVMISLNDIKSTNMQEVHGTIVILYPKTGPSVSTFPYTPYESMQLFKVDKHTRILMKGTYRCIMCQLNRGRDNRMWKQTTDFYCKNYTTVAFMVSFPHIIMSYHNNTSCAFIFCIFFATAYVSFESMERL